MANPQTENGYTRIANEILEAILVVAIPARHKDIWWFVVRKTYGFHKKQDRISLTQFQKGTRVDRSGVCRILKDLVVWRLLLKVGSVYAINKNYNQWVVAYRPLGGSGVQANRVVAYRPHTKETITKDILYSSKKPNNKKMKFDSDYEPIISEDGESVPNKEEVRDIKLKGDTTRVIAEFNRLYDAKITNDPQKKPRGSIPFIRKSVKEALKLYTAEELIELMPIYFDNDYYRTTAWAIWTMMSKKVLNSLKNGK